MTVSPNKKPEPGNVKITLLVTLLATIVGALGYWWYTTLVWEEKEIDLGYSKEALQNEFLAAEIFLRKHGIQATTVKNLSLLTSHRWRNIELGRDDTLVLINANKTLDEDRYDSLYEWVESGGTLITSTQNPFIGTHTNEEDLLLSDFGITPAEEESKEAKDLLDAIADELDEEKEDKPDNKENKEKTGTTTEKSSGEEKSVNEEKPAGEEKPTDEEKSKSADEQSKKAVKKDEPKKPENYYRCNLAEPPTDINFADETKPLHFDFSHEKPFTYHDNSSDEETGESVTSDDAIDDESTDATESPHNSEDIDEALNDEALNDESAIAEASATDAAIASSKEAHLLFFEIGDGSVTITSDNYIWTNRRIDCHDHAYALWSLVNPNGRVWFLVNQDAPSLAAIIWTQAKYAVLAGLLALVFWLWASGSRFGPVFTVPQEGRRSLAEHIYASAMLLWRKQQHPQLLALLRAEIMEQLAQQMLPSENAQQQIEYLHTLTGLSHSDIQHALFTSNLTHPQEFTRAIAHLQIIRKYL
ncbi:MAG: hypothetical protein B0W54_10655 [Cellvibrio sp. 79]|nr:MAG: hypothetical protein B0W54_10655 [Cellvibrio sp. 79]